MPTINVLHQFDTTQKKRFLMSYSAFLINGMLALSIGSLLPFVREARGLDYVFSGLLVSLHSVGNLCSSFLAGILPRFLGRKRSILFFNSFFALAFLLIIFGKSPVLYVLAFTMTGLARGGSSNFCNAVVNELATGKAWILNGLHAMFSVGAFLFPIILMLFTGEEASRWIWACWFLVVMGILSWLLYLFIPVETEVPKKNADARLSNDFGFLKESLFYLCVLTLFFYLCAEQGVIGWLITYFKDTGLLNANLSQLMASVQWIMMLVGRLTVAALSARVDKRKLLRITGIGFVVFCLVLLCARNTVVIVLGIMGFGFSMAGIYPTTVSFAGKLMQKYSYAWSFILTLASLGSILMPYVIGKIAGNIGIAYGMSSVIVVTVIDVIFIFVLTAPKESVR